MARQVIAPRVPFTDPKTGNITSPWLYWLMAVTGQQDSTDASQAFNAAIGQAATGEVQKFADDLNARSQFRTVADDSQYAIDQLRLLVQQVPVDERPDYEQQQLLPLSVRADTGEINRVLNDLQTLVSTTGNNASPDPVWMLKYAAAHG